MWAKQRAASLVSVLYLSCLVHPGDFLLISTSIQLKCLTRVEGVGKKKNSGISGFGIVLLLRRLKWKLSSFASSLWNLGTILFLVLF